MRGQAVQRAFAPFSGRAALAVVVVNDSATIDFDLPRFGISLLTFTSARAPDVDAGIDPDAGVDTTGGEPGNGGAGAGGGSTSGGHVGASAGAGAEREREREQEREPRVPTAAGVLGKA